MKAHSLLTKKVLTSLCLVLITIMSINIAGCAKFIPKVKAFDLMDGVKGVKVTGKEIDDLFIKNTADFSFKLYKESVDVNKNSLVSPLSVMLALSMTANGADNDTLIQMEQLLGNDIDLNDLNQYLNKYVSSLPTKKKSQLKISNSIWFRDDENRLVVEKSFLQTNASYYKAAAYKGPFDDKMLKDINNWVKTNTNGMIKSILDKINPDAVMYLINAIMFDAEWKTVYIKNDIGNGSFTNIKGEHKDVEFMKSSEYVYIENATSKGIVKPYANDNYSFVALLPNEDIPINDYVQSLTGDAFLELFNNKANNSVFTKIPKFSYEYTIKLNEPLIKLGMSNAFSPSSADFSKLGKSSNGNIFIGEVIHKTFISVDVLGTKAGAITKVEMTNKSAPQLDKQVILDRPFVYAIIDNATNLPIFIGTVLDID